MPFHMRDAHRMKEKFDLSLDNRQVVSFLIALLVVFGAVFVLGVVVGKKLASNQITATAPDLLTALDQKTTQFTFQDELTKKAPESLLSPVKAEVKEAPSPARTVEPETELHKALTRAAKEPVLPKETTAGGKFTLQLLATQTKDEAQRFLTRVRDRGYAPFIVEASVPGRGTWYRVRMGSFPTRDAAAHYLTDFRRETRMEAFVTGN